MRLYDPSRRSGSSIYYLNNYTIIRGLNILPLENNQVEISVWLPIKNDPKLNKRYAVSISLTVLLSVLEDFLKDPEKILEEMFCEEEFPPSLREAKESLKKKESFELLNDEDLLSLEP